MAQNNCIGKDNRMPWHIPDDLKRFKALTSGHPVIMGRKTFESILGYLGKPLPERTNIVISRARLNDPKGAIVLSNLDEAIKTAKAHAQKDGKEEIFIIGGAQIYNQAIDLADILHLTQVHKDVDGDAFFPQFDQNNWQEAGRTDHPDHDPPYSFITLKHV